MVKAFMKRVIRLTGFDLVRYRAKSTQPSFPPDVVKEDQAILMRAMPFTMTSVERLLALVHGVRHIVRNAIPGGILECGVWKGGSMMAVAQTLIEEGDTTRDLYLFDTFEGMTDPTDEDKDLNDTLARTRMSQAARGTGCWCYAGIREVEENMASTGYPPERVHFVKGKVEDTVPSQSPPGPLALLRLDTDWYESTRHELMHLFPLLQVGGVLVIDDYGHWQGARRATDQFLATQQKKYFLHRIDYTGRLLIK